MLNKDVIWFGLHWRMKTARKLATWVTENGPWLSAVKSSKRSKLKCGEPPDAAPEKASAMQMRCIFAALSVTPCQLLVTVTRTVNAKTLAGARVLTLVVAS
jgi:hypothetical protein